jgi:hypothetical protein
MAKINKTKTKKKPGKSPAKKVVKTLEKNPVIISEGLGDTIEKVLKKTGIDKVAKFLLGEDCGCDERKKKLNSLFRYGSPLCLKEDEHLWLEAWFILNKDSMKPSEQHMMLSIYNRIFKAKQPPTSCSSCLREINNKMFKVFETYKDGKTLEKNEES